MNESVCTRLHFLQNNKFNGYLLSFSNSSFNGKTPAKGTSPKLSTFRKSLPSQPAQYSLFL